MNLNVFAVLRQQVIVFFDLLAWLQARAFLAYRINECEQVLDRLAPLPRLLCDGSIAGIKFVPPLFDVLYDLYRGYFLRLVHVLIKVDHALLAVLSLLLVIRALLDRAQIDH